MASHHEIIDFIENIRGEMPARLHGFYEEAVDRALEQQHKRGKEFARKIIETNPMIRREFDHQKEEEGILAIFVLVVGFLGGAALMYLFDPDRGEQRRASLLGQVNHAAQEASDSLHDTADQVRGEVNKVANHASDTVKDTADQAGKAVNSASDNLKDSASQVRDQASKAVSSASSSAKAASEQVNAAVSDVTLTARVRAEIVRTLSTPGAIDVVVSEGVVTLKGQIPSSEVKGLIEKVQAISGVKRVDNRLEIHDAPAASGN